MKRTARLLDSIGDNQQVLAAGRGVAFRSEVIRVESKMTRLTKCSLVATCLIACLSTGYSQEVASFYSTTANDFVATVSNSEWEENAEGSYFVKMCPGYAGYELIYSADDDRSWIDVKYGETRSTLYSPTMEAAEGAFPGKDNDVVEWRGFVSPEGFHPYAIIYRLRASDPEDTERTFTRLIVVSTDEGKSTVLGSYAGDSANDRARARADAYASGE